jgi:hypothetical protein
LGPTNHQFTVGISTALSSSAHLLASNKWEQSMSKVPVTMRALVQRINRKLKPEWRRLHACRRNSRVWRDLGDYYVVDTYNDMVVDTCVAPEVYGRWLGVLGTHEVVAADEEMAA